MKFVLVMLALLANLAYAQSSECDRTCCEIYDGMWDDSYLMCDSPSDYTAYYECSSQCASTYGASSGASCCGPAFLLLALAGAAFIKG